MPTSKKTPIANYNQEITLNNLGELLLKNHKQMAKALNLIPIYLKAANVDDGARIKSLKKLDTSFGELKKLISTYLKLEKGGLQTYILKLVECNKKGGSKLEKSTTIKNIQNKQVKIKKAFITLRGISLDYHINSNSAPSTRLCLAHMFNFEQDFSKHLFLMEGTILPLAIELEKKYTL